MHFRFCAYIPCHRDSCFILVTGEAAAPHKEGKVVLYSCVVYGYREKSVLQSVKSVKITDIVGKNIPWKENVEPDFLLAILYSKI